MDTEKDEHSERKLWVDSICPSHCPTLWIILESLINKKKKGCCFTRDV